MTLRLLSLILCQLLGLAAELLASSASHRSTWQNSRSSSRRVMGRSSRPDGYDSFYWRLGTTPADVGLGYGEILTSAIPAIVLVMALAVGAAVLAVLGAAVLGWLLGRRPGLLWNERKRLARLVRPHRRTWLMLTIAGGLAVLLSVGVGVGRDAQAAVRDLKCGRGAESIRVFRFTLVHLEPPKVTMVWGASSQSPSGLPLGVPLWELGHTTTQVVLYEDETVGDEGNVGPVIVPLNSVGLITSNMTSPTALSASCQ